MPSLDKTDVQCESILKIGRDEALIEYQRKFEYEFRSHVIMEILMQTGIRGVLHALYTDEYDEVCECLIIHNRSDSGTPLKNGDVGERIIAMNAEVCQAIDAWRDHQHRTR